MPSLVGSEMCIRDRLEVFACSRSDNLFEYLDLRAARDIYPRTAVVKTCSSSFFLPRVCASQRTGSVGPVDECSVWPAGAFASSASFVLDSTYDGCWISQRDSGSAWQVLRTEYCTTPPWVLLNNSFFFIFVDEPQTLLYCYMCMNTVAATGRSVHPCS